MKVFIHVFVNNIMLQNEIELIFEKYKSMDNVSDEDNIDVKKSDLNKDGKLSSYEKARGKAIDKATGGDGKLSKSEDSEEISKIPSRKITSFEKYKLSQAKKFLKNAHTFNKMLSHMSGFNEKEARKIVKKYS
jgi:hypothetical protein